MVTIEGEEVIIPYMHALRMIGAAILTVSELSQKAQYLNTLINLNRKSTIAYTPRPPDSL